MSALGLVCLIGLLLFCAPFFAVAWRLNRAEAAQEKAAARRQREARIRDLERDLGVTQ